MSKPVTLSKQLIVSVVELINFYSEKGVFKIKEYKDIAELDARLRTVLLAMENNTPFEELSAEEFSLIVSVFKEGTQRLPTAIDSFGHIYSIYQAFQTLLEQKLAEKKERDAVPSIEELEK